MTQAALIGSVAILTAIVLLRVVVLFRRQYARVPHRYPGSWTDDQIKTFEHFRLSMGVSLAITWIILQMTASRMPDSWPFGLEQTLLTIGLLLLSNGWLLLLIPSNWEHSIFSKMRFAYSFAALALWWITLLSGILVTIGLATMRHVQILFLHGPFA